MKIIYFINNWLWNVVWLPFAQFYIKLMCQFCEKFNIGSNSKQTYKLFYFKAIRLDLIFVMELLV